MVFLRYLKELFKHWWALMSCALWTALGFYVALNSKPNDWLIRAMAASATLCVFWAAYLVWVDASKKADRLALDKLQIEQKYFDERPILGLKILSTTGRKAWADAVDLMNTPIHFSIHHLGGRVAMSVRFDPIPSLLGKFSLRLDGLPFVDPPVKKMVSYEIWEDGKPPHFKTIESIGWAAMLQPFLSNSPPELNEFRYPITVRFLDRGEERHQDFTMVFNARTWELFVD
jgi:hypothetical protein